ncbi:MAG: ferritin-like domain-containing protein [Verrucomicrobiae bacterium]|nr:ferritin-like domain-containing protein [Verrucomicrobiae bacterium]
MAEKNPTNKWTVFPSPGFSRRDFLIKASLMGVTGLWTLEALATPAEVEFSPEIKGDYSGAREDARVLNSSLALEHMLVAFYEHACKSILFKAANQRLAERFLGHHKLHRDMLMKLITRLGGVPTNPLARYDLESFKSERDLIKSLVDLESLSSYNYAQNMPLLKNPLLILNASQILGAEAWHTAAWRMSLGENPAPTALLQ